MPIKYILAIAFLLACATGFAQNIIGLRGGINYASEIVTGSPIPAGVSVDYDTRVGFFGGLYFTRMISTKLAIQPEIFYTSLGTSIITTGLAPIPDIASNYLSLPIFFRANLPSNFHFLLGPQVSYILSAKETIPSAINPVSRDVKDQFNTLDVSIVTGFGVDIENLNICIRYSYGLSNVWKNAPENGFVRNYAFHVAFGYRLSK